MPWRKFVTNWIEALTSSPSSLNVSSVGRESESQTLVCRVENFAPSGETEVLSLYFPDGQRVAQPPLWTRRSASSDTVLVGLKADCKNDLRLLERAPNTRRSPRVAARFWTLFLDGPRTGALTRDLSLEGCRVEGDFRAFLGAEVRLCLEFYDSPEPLHLRGRIVWAEAHQAGVQFLNIHVFDEVRLLRVLGGVAPAPPSTFLPTSGSNLEPYEYTLSALGEERYKLEIDAPNWCFRIDLASATVIGPPRGDFHHFQLHESSLPLRRLRAKQKICLERPRRFVHLLLKSSKEEMVLDLVGEEVGFERVPRIQKPIEEAV